MSKIDSVERNRKQQDQTLDNPLPVRNDAEEIEHVADHGEHERASDRSPDRAPPAEQIHSAENSGADARELIGIPDERIAWRSTSGPKNSGVVSFHPLDVRRTRVMLQMEYEPEGIVENAGDKLGVVSMRLQGDLNRFKKFIESRGVETGAWRGSI